MITMIFLSLLGGTCLLLYGLQLSGQGLQGVAGTRLRTIINAVTQHRFLGVGAGAIVTTLFQSSSATTVMLVGFASAGLITLDQTIALILGADQDREFGVAVVRIRHGTDLSEQFVFRAHRCDLPVL